MNSGKKNTLQKEGYSICVHAQSIDVVLPHQVTMHHALQINQAGLYLDGIEDVEEDGTVVFTDETMMFYRDIFGYECKSLPLSEVEERAMELQERYLVLTHRSS